jgi:phosphoglycerate dehydrogenase-like enzyme
MRQSTLVIDAIIPPEQEQRVLTLSPQLTVLKGISPENLARAEVIYTIRGQFDPAAAPQLRWVQTNGVGVNHLVGSPIAQRGIPVANVCGAYSPAVAECAVGLLVTINRRFHLCHSLQAARQWPQSHASLAGRNCAGGRLGIIGYGSIGRHCARIAHGMGMKILALKRDPQVRKQEAVFSFPGAGDPEGQLPVAWFGMGQLPEMLGQCDAAIITLPLTEATRGFVGRAALAAMPPHAVLINVGRGGLLDEAALIEQLQQGRLGGAGLDVFATEPLPADSPLWTLPNVVITPHIASYTDDQLQLAAEVLIENLRRDLAGRPLAPCACGARGRIRLAARPAKEPF